ncbi:MAG TPA: ABC transporter permease [Gaiellaceae bacterium]|nr:ABC transporter permease [Gaiellaceae bacterium]
MTAAETGFVLPGVSRRGAQARTLLVSAAGVVLAFLVGGLLVLVAGGRPVAAFRSMFSGTLGSGFAIGELLVTAAPLLLIGLGLALAFRGRVYNIGAEGQLFVGALAGGTVALELGGPGPLLIALAMVAGIAGGALWASVVGVLRARFRVNEVISSLLMNYVGIFGFDYVVRKPLGDPAAGNALASRQLPDETMLPSIPHLFAHVGIFVALGAVPVVWYAMRVTPFGFRVRMMGLNPEATQVAGVDTRRLIVVLMAVSGGLAGLAGVIQVVGVEGRMDGGISASYGFTAIVVALLGRLTAPGVLAAALLIAFLNVGGQAMSVDNGLPYSIVLAIEGVFVLFVLIADRFARAAR